MTKEQIQKGMELQNTIDKCNFHIAALAQIAGDLSSDKTGENILHYSEPDTKISNAAEFLLEAARPSLTAVVITMVNEMASLKAFCEKEFKNL